MAGLDASKHLRVDQYIGDINRAAMGALHAMPSVTSNTKVSILELG